MFLKLALSVVLVTVFGLHGITQAQDGASDEKPVFNPERHSLYTQSELQAGFDAKASKPGFVDKVYAQYVRAGMYPSASMARARSLHDDGITVALHNFIATKYKSKEFKGVVTIMGAGNDDIRCTNDYRRVASLAQTLAKHGYLIATGGASGMMEAANLGAYLADEDDSAIAVAIDTMRGLAKQNSDKSICEYDNGFLYTEAAQDVLKKFPHGHENISVPTYFYGFEPPNVFATQVALYFSDGLREQMLVAIGDAGMIFTSGRAGTRQQIFTAAAQNHIGTACHVSPMVFFGEKEFGDTGIFPLVYKLAEPAAPPVYSYRAMLLLTDREQEVITFLHRNPPRYVRGTGLLCSDEP